MEENKMKLYSCKLIQKGNDLFVGGYKSEKPNQLNYFSKKRSIKNWQKSYTEYKVHESCKNKFIELAESEVSALIGKTYFDNLLKAGISLPDGRVEVKADYTNCQFTSETGWNPKPKYYAFLIEETKEDVNYVHVEGTKILPSTLTTTDNTEPLIITMDKQEQTQDELLQEIATYFHLHGYTQETYNLIKKQFTIIKH